MEIDITHSNALAGQRFAHPSFACAPVEVAPPIVYELAQPRGLGPPIPSGLGGRRPTGLAQSPIEICEFFFAGADIEGDGVGQDGDSSRMGSDTRRVPCLRVVGKEGAFAFSLLDSSSTTPLGSIPAEPRSVRGACTGNSRGLALAPASAGVRDARTAKSANVTGWTIRYRCPPCSQSARPFATRP